MGKPKIVILDDNELFADLMAAALEEEFDVKVGHNGLQGITLCLQNGAAAVVTDIGMPDLDGIQMLTEFKKNPLLAGIPVLVVTATHFNSISRDTLSRFPQVKRTLSKILSVAILTSEIKAVLRETGGLPAEENLAA